MAQLPLRSLRLQKRSAASLDTLNGNSGEIFYDADNRALRLYTGDGADKIVFASRTWVLNNTFNGNYLNLTNRPSIPSNVSDLVNDLGFITAVDNPAISGLAAITGAVDTVDHDFDLASVWYHSGQLADFTANFTNVPTTDNRVTRIRLILVQGATAWMPTAAAIDGVTVAIRWLDGVSTGTADGIDLVDFDLIRVAATWTVLASVAAHP